MRIRILLLLVVFASSLHGQTFRGTIRGNVSDQSGAALTDAKVTTTGLETGLIRNVLTGSSGDFVFPELPAGTYKVSASHDGFKSQTVDAVRVGISAPQTVNFQLTPGSVQEVVQVTGATPQVDISSDTMGGTIEGRQASELPVNGRDFTKLLVLTPGSTGDPSGATDSPGSFGLFSSNGNRGRSNNYLLDGTDMNDGYRNLPSINEAGVFGTPATILPVDALSEIPVLSGAEAEYGRNSGAIVNLITRSGTNDFHGSAFEYFRNNWLDARNFFNAKPQPQNAFHNNQFGGSFGGPIAHDRSFFFVAYEGQRESVGIPSISRVPDPITDIAANGGPTNPVIAKLLALNPWPKPNITPDSNGNNLQATTTATNRVDSMIAKFDQHFHQNDVFTARYFFGNSDQSFPLALLGGNVLPGFNTITPTTVNVISLSLTHLFSPRTLLELRGGYNRFSEQFLPQDQTFNPNSIGLATTNNPQDFGLPLIQVQGFAPIGSNLSLPRGRVDTNSQVDANLSYNTGRHSFKGGYEFRRTFINGFFDAGYRGKLVFDTIQDFLAGNLASSGSRQAQGYSTRDTFQNNHSVYIQDTFKLTRQLTLNYGLRWDYFGVLGEEKNRLSLFNPTTGLVPAVSQLYPKDYNNFAPRVSFAYDVRGDAKTVLRAGWGLFYDAFSQDFFVGQLPFNTFNPGPAYNGIGVAPILFSFSPVATIAPNVAVFPASSFAATDVFTVDQKIRTPYVQNYNFNVQQQLSSTVAMQVGFVGSSGRKLFRFRDINQQTNPSGTRPFDNLAVPGPSPAGTTFVYVNQFESTATSNYNSLQATLNVRPTHGLGGSMTYTWSHSIDNASDGQDYVPNASQPDNSFAPGRERANSNFDSRNRFTAFFTYDFPASTRMPLLASGWAFNGVFTYSSGMPVNVNYLFEGDFNGSGEFFGRPDVVGDPLAGRSTPTSFLNLSAFQVPCAFDPASGGCSGGQHFGNLRRNAFRGPNYANFDFSIVKNTKFMDEKLNVQFRADAFNLVNHPNFSNPLLPTFGVDFAANGLDDSGRGIGFLPITATPDVGIGNPFLGGGGPRNLQLAVKFTF